MTIHASVFLQNYKNLNLCLKIEKLCLFYEHHLYTDQLNKQTLKNYIYQCNSQNLCQSSFSFSSNFYAEYTCLYARHCPPMTSYIFSFFPFN